MKKIYPIRITIIVLLSLMCFTSIGQTYTMSATPLSTCSGTWLDPGGTGNYSHNTDITQTICSSSNSTLKISFTAFSLGTGDYLTVYDGNSITAPLIGTFTGSYSPTLVVSSTSCLTFRFVSDGSGSSTGWSATITCVSCVAASTGAGSPCAFDGANPFCTDENPYGITYSSGTSGSAQNFFGTENVGCLYSVPAPAWYFMRINTPGDLLIYIEQYNTSGVGIDVDFACWGPFTAASATNFMDNLCCGYYSLNTATSNGSHRPYNGNHNGDMGGYPSGNLVDCSYNAAATEWCYIPNAQTGQYYILLITNYNGSSGTITFSPVAASSTAATDCSLLAQITSNAPICEHDTLRLFCQNPESGATYAWTGPNNWTSSLTNPIIPNATTSMSGEYTLVKSLNGQSSPAATISITINPYPVVSVTATAELVCSDQQTTITATGGGSYLWSNGMTTNAITVSPDSSRYYSVLVTSDENCSTRDSLYVRFAEADTIHFEDHMCVGDDYHGYGFSLSAQTIAGDTLLQNVLVNANGCDSIVKLTLHRTIPPSITVLDFGREHCEQQDGYIYVNVSNGTQPLNYTWTPTLSGRDSLVGLSAGTYQLRVVDALTCEAFAEIIVLGSPAPVACIALSPSQNNYTLGTSIQFINCSQNYTNWLWILNDTTFFNEQNFSYTYPETGIYTVTLAVSDDDGCTDTVQQTIDVRELLRIYVPNSFTPNNDGINDVFMPSGIEISEDNYFLAIYNRWGELVFKTTNLTQGWDGTFNGHKAQEGAMFSYFIRYQNLDGRQFIKRGLLTVL